MISKKHIEKLTNECLFGTDRFIVAIKLSTDNSIRIFIDSDSSVTIENCVELSRYIESYLDRDDEDFELSVASAGAEQPFALLRQYINNIDNLVQVTDNEGTKIKGILKKASTEEIEILEQLKNKNKKIKKITFGDLIKISIDNIKETKRIITF
jgi:ribosome maturation factor RimP